jgi:hypothetical protein
MSEGQVKQHQFTSIKATIGYSEVDSVEVEREEEKKKKKKSGRV